MGASSPNGDVFVGLCEDLRHDIHGAITDARGAAYFVDASSQLASEQASCATDIGRHFLQELPRHATMLIAAIMHGLLGLANLGSELPYSSNLVARGLLEASADLFCIGDRSIGGEERACRALNLYAVQVQTEIRQMRQLASKSAELNDRMFDGISEGEEMVKELVETARSAGITAKKSKWNHRWQFGAGLGTATARTEIVVKEFHGETGVPLYALQSSVAHAQGNGLAALLKKDDMLETPKGPLIRYGMTVEQWADRCITPTLAVVSGAVQEWIHLALPSRASHP